MGFGHLTCLTNLAQQLIEKQFLLLNGQTMPIENLFVVKQIERRESQKFYLLIYFLIESNNTTSLNLNTEFFNNCFFSYTKHNNMEKHLSLYFFFSCMKRSKCQTLVLLKSIFSLCKS